MLHNQQRQCLTQQRHGSRVAVSRRRARCRAAAAPKEGLSYKAAGVDISAGDELVRRIQKMNPSIGGFSGMVPFGDSFLVAGTDGVGTKLKLAFDMNKHDTVGIDLVAMSVNDIVTSGAKPLFFLDYYATGARLGSSQPRPAWRAIRGAPPACCSQPARPAPPCSDVLPCTSARLGVLGQGGPAGCRCWRGGRCGGAPSNARGALPPAASDQQPPPPGPPPAGFLEVDVAEAVVKGIVEGCKQSGCQLLGGETAEMPGFYQKVRRRRTCRRALGAGCRRRRGERRHTPVPGGPAAGRVRSGGLRGGRSQAGPGHQRDHHPSGRCGGFVFSAQLLPRTAASRCSLAAALP